MQSSYSIDASLNENTPTTPPSTSDNGHINAGDVADVAVVVAAAAADAAADTAADAAAGFIINIPSPPPRPPQSIRVPPPPSHSTATPISKAHARYSYGDAVALQTSFQSIFLTPFIPSRINPCYLVTTSASFPACESRWCLGPGLCEFLCRASLRLILSSRPLVFCRQCGLAGSSTIFYSDK